jgi:DNA helicase-2/ATP-dependent DNA helicase PcrA
LRWQIQSNGYSISSALIQSGSTTSKPRSIHQSMISPAIIIGATVLRLPCSGRFRQSNYRGIEFGIFDSNPNQAFATLIAHVLQARKRLIEGGERDWSLAILVPTKKMTRLMSDKLREPFGAVPPINHTAAVDMEGPILAAEIIAFLLQQGGDGTSFDQFVELLCGFFHGRGGAAPTKSDLDEAARFRAALSKWNECLAAGKPAPAKSVLKVTGEIYRSVGALSLTGDPDKDWLAVRAVLETGGCSRLKEVAKEVRNVRLLERGTQLRQGLAQDWRDSGRYRNALAITRQAVLLQRL